MFQDAVALALGLNAATMIATAILLLLHPAGRRLADRISRTAIEGR